MQKKSKNPENADFYVDRWDGTLNLTSPKRLPMILTKLYCLDGDSEMQCSKIYDNKNKEILANRDRDDIYIDCEPFSGVELNARLNL